MPDHLPPPLQVALDADPFALLRDWLAEAAGTEPNDPNAMSLATVDAEGRPSSRMVLLKGLDRGLCFYTNKQSRKGSELAANRHAALLFHWKSLRRQVRAEGMVEDVTDAEADAYFASRARVSRLGAAASDQSRPLSSTAPSWSAGWRHWTRAIPATRCPARRTGRAIGCCRIGSSSGRTCRTACTTAPCSSAGAPGRWARGEAVSIATGGPRHADPQSAAAADRHRGRRRPRWPTAWMVAQAFRCASRLHPRAPGQPRRRAAGRRGPVRGDDRGDDVGQRERERPARRRCRGAVRPLRGRPRHPGRPERRARLRRPPPASSRWSGARTTRSRSSRGWPTSRWCRIPRRTRICRPRTRCMRCCSTAAGRC